MIASIVERVFRVDNPTPKPGLRRIIREERKRAGVARRHLLRDTWRAVKGFG
jgi:electron transfer flavoprotein-quinone oxidoreductase